MNKNTKVADARWTDNKRSDGCAIVQGVDSWVIMPADEGLPLALCPCCDKPFATPRSARLVADFMFPLRAP